MEILDLDTASDANVKTEVHDEITLGEILFVAMFLYYETRS